MNKEIIAPAFDNKYRYLSLYEESININSQLESEESTSKYRFMIEDVYYRCLLQLHNMCVM